MLAIEVIRDAARFTAFIPEWRIFLEKTPPATPFQRPEWLVTWWSHFGSGELHMLVFRAGREVVGVLPSFLHSWNGRRQLTLLGTGLTDYLDPLFSTPHIPAILTALQLHLEDDEDWEICDWQDLSMEIPLRGTVEMRPDNPCSRIPLAASFEEYLAARPKDLRRNLRKYREKAEAAGALRFDVTTQADPFLIHALIELHATRWRTRGESGMIEANHAAEFLRDAVAALASVDALLIFTLKFQEEIAAIILAFRDNTTIYGYLTGLDPQQEYFSFGRDLLARALEYAHRSGFRYWDFLRGEEAYKLDWGPEIVAKHRLLLTKESQVLEAPSRPAAAIAHP